MATSAFQTTNPATGEIIAEYEHLDRSQIEQSLSDAYDVYVRERELPVYRRVNRLRALAAAFRDDLDELSKIMTAEMGKAVRDSEAEIEKCAKAFDYYADNLDTMLKPEESTSGYRKSAIVKDPIGPILAIMPWNFPVWQVVRFAAPAVGVGNPILLKHADITAGTAERMSQIFQRVETGLLFNLRIDHEQAAEVIGDRRVSGVTLTGSARAGREVAQAAGRSLKKTVLELGGSDAYLVLSDADISLAAETCANARMINNGQSCVAAKRFIVHESVFDEFVSGFMKAISSFRYGDPTNPKTRVGSLAAKRFQKELLEQCQRLEKQGAQKVLDLGDTSGFDANADHAFFPARAYHANPDLDLAHREELFGPVALVFRVRDENAAVANANKSIYGLGAAVFSRDEERAARLARRLEAGFVAVNDQVKSDPRLPFGGVKDSGYGRELSLYGFNEFCNIKTIGFGAQSRAGLGSE